MLGRAAGNIDTQDSPRPGLGGSHHLPPYSILCSFRRRIHPNGYFPQDSQVGVPKLSRVGVSKLSRIGVSKLSRVGVPKLSQVGVPELWKLTTPDCRVRSRRGLNQSCSPRRDRSNAMLRSQIGCWEDVDSRLLVIWSQTANLTPGLSFGHNLCFRCPNEQCEPILGI